MIVFVITKNDITKTFECNLEDSILSLKNNIIKEFDLVCNYIDIDFQLERPIRSLGKFNLESPPSVTVCSGLSSPISRKLFSHISCTLDNTVSFLPPSIPKKIK